MRTGYVDETWAKEHHEYWYEDIKAGRSRQRFADELPAEARSRVLRALTALKEVPRASAAMPARPP